MRKYLTSMAFALASLAAIARIDAGQIDLTSYNHQGVAGTTEVQNVVEYGGAATATLDGMHLTNMYCVEAFTNISPNTNYPTTISFDGTVHGQQVGSASQIAYLLATYSRTSAVENSLDKQNALQAAIWHLSAPVTGHSFDMSSSAAGYSDYTSYLVDAGHHTSFDVSKAIWISPYNSDLVTPAQGFAAAVPEPSTFALLGLGGIGLGIRAVRRRRAKSV